MLKKKKILIMGMRNKWSIAYGIAKSARDSGAELIFTYRAKNKDKMFDLLSEFPGATYYELLDASDEVMLSNVLNKIKEDHGQIDGIVHAIAHANTDDLHNDYIYTSKEGFLHALDVSTYSFTMLCRLAKEIALLKPKASLLTLSYYGSTKVLPGYNVMGVAKAALESSVRYLAFDLGKDDVRVNAISAGPITTISAKGIKDFNSILDIVETKAPLHRNVTIEEVGSIATFILSENSSAITGQVIYADNGYSIMGI